MTDRVHNLVNCAICAIVIAAVLTKFNWPADLRRPCEIVGGLVGLFLIWGLVARTIRAFVQGINEGHDPRHAKRPLDPP